MVRRNEIRAGELMVEAPAPRDAGLISSPHPHALARPPAMPAQGRPDGPTCRIEVFEPWVAALDGITEYSGSRCSIGCISRGAISSGRARATTAAARHLQLRSPVRPNPIGTQLVTLVGRRGRTSSCAASTASTARLIDLKPDRCAFTPLAPRQAGDDQVGDGQ